MGGRLEHFYQNWTQTTDNKWVLQAIKGHQLEFQKIPLDSTQCYQRKLNPDQTAALDKEVQDLIEKGAIERVSGPGGGGGGGVVGGFTALYLWYQRKMGGGTPSST